MKPLVIRRSNYSKTKEWRYVLSAAHGAGNPTIMVRRAHGEHSGSYSWRYS
jgi:hypothetical protein